MLEDEKGQAKTVSKTFIVDLLQIFPDRIECVLLNACDSEPLADEIAKHINYAIGMNRPHLLKDNRDAEIQASLNVFLR